MVRWPCLQVLLLSRRQKSPKVPQHRCAVVWAETALDGRWSDNGMLMTTDVMQLQWFTDDTTVTASELAASLSVRSLFDMSHSYSRDCAAKS